VSVSFYLRVFEIFSFVLGAMIGSFLNVCIYRLPLGLSVNEPRRSFCPHCKKQIPWTQNLPLISWLALRGKCKNCGAPIAFRYFGVELLMAVLFLAVWLKCWVGGRSMSWELAFPYWIFVSLLVVATFIDFEHFIIPDEITWGGVCVGIVSSFALPAMMDSNSHLISMLLSLAGAATGYVTLWLVVELGKKAFGKKRILLEKPEPFTWTRDGDDADLKIGNEDAPMRWSDLFSRETDLLLIKISEAAVAEKIYGETTLQFYYNRLLVEGDEFQLEKLDVISGITREIVIPREAMGFGDVKFIAAIGAFLGWKAVFFSILVASLTGAIVGVTTILAGKREWSAKIPFGPYLAFGALIWLFAGPEIVEWYLRFGAPPPDAF